MSDFVRSEYYHLGLSAYLTRSTDTCVIKTWFQDEIPHLITRTATGRPEHEPCRVLAIASGPGDRDLELLQVLIGLEKKIQYTVVDPNVTHIRMFQERVIENPQFKHVDFRFYVVTFERFYDEEFDKGPYHLVHLIHSIEYINDTTEELLQKFLFLLAKGGSFVGVELDANQGCMKVMAKNQERIHGKSGRISFEKDLKFAAKGLGVSLEKYMFKVYLDIGVVLDKKFPEADYILDFMSEVRDFRTEAPSFCQELISDLKNETVMHDGKPALEDIMCVYVTHPSD